MSFSMKILPEVEDDAVNAYMWYEAKSLGLGEEFLSVFYTYLEHSLNIR